MKAIVTNIEYDTEGENVELPTRLEIDIPIDLIDAPHDEVDEYISDEITNITGWCHLGFDYELE